MCRRSPWTVPPSSQPNGRCDVIRKRDLRRLSRGLRFRLTAGYALFFALLLLSVATLFRQRLQRVQMLEVQDTLEQEWGALKGYMRIELASTTYYACWYFDDKDPDEATIVLDLKKVYVITDANGNVVTNCLTHEPEISTTYDDIGVDKATIKMQVREAVASKKATAYFRERQDS